MAEHKVLNWTVRDEAGSVVFRDQLGIPQFTVAAACAAHPIQRETLIRLWLLAREQGVSIGRDRLARQLREMIGAADA